MATRHPLYAVLYEAEDAVRIVRTVEAATLADAHADVEVDGVRYMARRVVSYASLAERKANVELVARRIDAGEVVYAEDGALVTA